MRARQASKSSTGESARCLTSAASAPADSNSGTMSLKSISAMTRRFGLGAKDLGLLTLLNLGGSHAPWNLSPAIAATCHRFLLARGRCDRCVRPVGQQVLGCGAVLRAQRY